CHESRHTLKLFFRTVRRTMDRSKPTNYIPAVRQHDRLVPTAKTSGTGCEYHSSCQAGTFVLAELSLRTGEEACTFFSPRTRCFVCAAELQYLRLHPVPLRRCFTHESAPRPD